MLLFNGLRDALYYKVLQGTLSAILFNSYLDMATPHTWCPFLQQCAACDSAQYTLALTQEKGPAGAHLWPGMSHSWRLQSNPRTVINQNGKQADMWVYCYYSFSSNTRRNEVLFDWIYSVYLRAILWPTLIFKHDLAHKSLAYDNQAYGVWVRAACTTSACANTAFMGPTALIALSSSAWSRR